MSSYPEEDYGRAAERARIRKAQQFWLRELKRCVEFVAANGDYCDEGCDFVAGRHVDGCVPSDMFICVRKLRAATKEPLR